MATAVPSAQAQNQGINAAVATTVSQQGADVVLEWPGVHSSASALSTLPQTRFQGYELPMRLTTVQLPPDGQAISLQVEQLSTIEWTEAIQPAAALTPPVLDWQANPDLTQHEALGLPTAPLFVLREGRIHNQRVAVIGMSPLYQENGRVKLATQLVARISGATLVEGELSDFLHSSREQVQVTSSGAIASTVDLLDPTNPVASTSAIKVLVYKAGLQSISGLLLNNAGLNLTTDPTRLQLFHNGIQIPLEISGLSNGKLTTASTLRFFAPKVGDRWNLREVYWLTVGASNGLRMSTRSVAPANAPTRNTVREQGVWQQYGLYSSLQPGLDGDHWFHEEIKFDASANPVRVIPLKNVLPPASGNTTMTLTLSTGAKAQFRLQFALGNQQKEVSWHSAPQNTLQSNWSHTVTLPSGAPQVQIKMVAGDAKNGLLYDHLFWEQSALLDFNNQSANFWGVSGLWRYQWQDRPANATLYDITDAVQPVLLTGATAAGFQDGPTPHRYLLVKAGDEQIPEVLAHTPVLFSRTTGADAIYIAPSEFLVALEPLLAYRRTRGYSVISVNVQDIYDAWSFGHVSAPAIRTFLRFAHANWTPKPVAVTLVGDGTWDPHDYENKYNGGAHISNFIPPYLAYVDPWLREAACENCYAQLDGDDPLTGDNPSGAPGDFFAADLWIGRLPAHNALEVSDLVSKLIRYEKNNTPEAWRGISLFLADNHVQSLAGNDPVFDPAGDFAEVSDQVIQSAPDKLNIQRIYYDPYPKVSDPTHQEPWRIADAASARNTGLTAMSHGAGIVVYNGHSHHWQWARLDSAPELDGLLSLYDPDGFTNNDRFFITLSMTCLTSQFQKPAASGTVLDERTLLNPTGGAIAVWGPAGLSVVHGHDALQRGFFTALKNAPPMTARLGELLEAGYTELLTNNNCCQDALQTFLLLGDPLTPAQVMPINTIHLPLVNR
jgi:hypothetical protein